ncbi:hypothetical protein ANO14919_145940 [Xylariales sp. No.14919]|nr:hypothetical protein ANO14919_145940 [Xylariales sp. No.14919]
MTISHHARPSPMSPVPGTHRCGCQGTNHALPKLVSFFQNDGDRELSYDDEIPLPEDMGLESACAQCQLKTQRGVETAISAIHCGPDSLVDHNIIAWMFISLLALRRQQGSLRVPEPHDESEDLDDGDERVIAPARTTTTTSYVSSRTPIPTPRRWDWEYIWREWVKAFELRRDRVDVAHLLRDLSKLSLPRRESWWPAALQELGVEALLVFEDYMSMGLVPPPSSTDLSAWRRHVDIIQSIDDLFDLYVNIDTQVHGYTHAHRMLRMRWRCRDNRIE